MTFSFLLAVLLALFSVHTPYLISSPVIETSLEESLIDQKIAISIKNLQPLETISVQASTIDDNNSKWISNATFNANACGIVNIDNQAPIKGSYEGADSLGLLWSMQPESGQAVSFKVKNEKFSVDFKVFRDGQPIASKEITRLRKSREVKEIYVRENGIVGILFLPSSEIPLPVIITLSGSNGGLGESRAQLLASHGFAVIALGYFGVEGLPPNLQDISLEYFESAFDWIKHQSNLDCSHVGIYGTSRGAELALILGALFPKSVQAIVATVPSSVIYGGFSETPVHAWRYHGEPLSPFAPVLPIDFNNGKGDDANYPANTLNSFLDGIKDEKAFNAAAIPVEKIQASLLVISGGDDQMWPSAFYASQIEKRLKEKHSPILFEHLYYPKAGHGINIPNLPQSGPLYYHPIGKKWLTLGGSIAYDQYASQDSWEKLIQFFRNQFNIKPSQP